MISARRGHVKRADRLMTGVAAKSGEMLQRSIRHAWKLL
jgi:hypothetical protein